MRESRNPKIKQTSDFQIVVKDVFVKDEEIQQYFKVADYAFALYNKHFGMSAIMVRAAAAQKPLISSNFGLIGKIVEENELGITIDNDLKEKLVMLLNNVITIGNKEKMRVFAELNQADNYAKVILEHFKSVSR